VLRTNDSVILRDFGLTNQMFTHKLSLMEKFTSKRQRILLSHLILLMVLSVSTTAMAQVTPRIVPGTFKSLGTNRQAAVAAVGLQQFYSATGKYTLSADGKGSTSSSLSVRVRKPNAQATVAKAILISAVTFTTIANGCVTIAGSPVNWAGTAASSFFNNYWADVTSVVAPIINAAPAGISTINITECNTSRIEGEALLVIFNDPTTTEKTIIVMLGAQNPSGDNFSVTFAEAIDPTKAGALLEMGLGIGFSYQENGVNQASQVSVNGQRLSSSAGGEDDGDHANGALLTVGGIDDANTNPANPQATPTDPRSDDELYSILPFITTPTTNLDITTLNPSLDDNIFLAYFVTSGAAIIGEGIVLSQTTTSGNVGTTHSVKAKIVNDNGDPVANRAVKFTVTSGPNAGTTGTVMTNSNGEASYTYTGSGGAGTDNIQACFTNSESQEECSNTLSFAWVVPTTPDVYYSKASGNLHNVLTWGVNMDGSGANPPNFGAGKTFHLVNRSGVYSLTGNWTVGGNLVNMAGNKLQIGSYTLSIANLTGGGTLSGTMTSNLIVTGSSGGNQTLNFTAGSNNLGLLTINRSGAGAAATLSSSLNIYGVLNVQRGMFNTGNKLTLKSQANTTARVAPLMGTIMGTVTVEQYIPARRAWRLINAPVTGTGGTITGQASLTHSQETTQGTLTTSTGNPRPESKGTATFSLNAARTALMFTATIYNIDVTGTQTPGDNNDNLVAAHIHVGALPGSNAPVRWGFFGMPDNDISPKNTTLTPFASGVGGTFAGTWDLPEGNAGTTLTDNLPAILNGLAYINLHTVQFGGGEIRGQINMIGEGTQTVKQAWQENASSATHNPAPGFGTHITGGPIYGTAARGFDINTHGRSESSLKYYDAGTSSWLPIQNTNATLVGNTPFMLFVRGSRGILLDGPTQPPTTTVLRAMGNLITGDRSYNVASTGITAVTNPYQSPVNFASLTRNNVQNLFYLWDPKLGGANGVGGYVTVSWNGSSYDITPAPVSPESQYIQPWQSFLVKSTGASGTLTVKESDKVSFTTGNVFRTGNAALQQNLRVNLQVQNSDNSWGLVDEVLASFNAQYSNKVDEMDIEKMQNFNENLAFTREGRDLVMERRALLKTSDTLFLRLTNTVLGSYRLGFKPTGVGSSAPMLLEDLYQRRATPLSLHKDTEVGFVVTTDPASQSPTRFRVVFGESKLGNEFVLNNILAEVSPNPVRGSQLNLRLINQPQGLYTVTVLNTLGQVVAERRFQHAGGTAMESIQARGNLAKGVYQVRIARDKANTTLSILAE
jgi:hypothetical protein